MPELPEVETVRSQLEKELVGEVISQVKVIDDMCFSGDSKNVIGAKIENIERWGKWLGIMMSNGTGMDIHLKMTGRMVVPPEYESMPHTRVIIEMESGRKVYYWDIRRFGYVRVWDSYEVMRKSILSKLGPDPFEASGQYLSEVLGKTDRMVKEVILDQSKLAGVGNIYANDALWLAGVDPRVRGRQVSKSTAEKILNSIREVLQKGLRLGGASDNTYRDVYDGKGGYQEEFLVYGKTGGKCMRCGGDLKRIVIGGRGTWMCENCQQ